MFGIQRPLLICTLSALCACSSAHNVKLAVDPVSTREPGPRHGERGLEAWAAAETCPVLSPDAGLLCDSVDGPADCELEPVRTRFVPSCDDGTFATVSLHTRDQEQDDYLVYISADGLWRAETSLEIPAQQVVRAGDAEVIRLYEEWTHSRVAYVTYKEHRALVVCDLSDAQPVCSRPLLETYFDSEKDGDRALRPVVYYHAEIQIDGDEVVVTTKSNVGVSQVALSDGVVLGDGRYSIRSLATEPMLRW